LQLAGLALIIIGSVAAAKLTPYSSAADVHFNGVGVFIIVIGIVIFLISFFGCLGAYKENYCLLITVSYLQSYSIGTCGGFRLVLKMNSPVVGDDDDDDDDGRR